MKKLNKLLENFDLSKPQAEAFLYLYQFGPKPASSVASAIGLERTNTYKMLQSLNKKGLIAETTKHKTKQFFVPNKQIFSHKLEQQQKEIIEKQKKLPELETELAKLDNQRISPIPLIRFFEGKTEIDNLFEDMYNYIKEKKYLVIKMFASNTLETQSTSAKNLSNYADFFFEKLKQSNINVEAYLGNGILMLENLIKTYDTNELITLPAGNSAINIFIIGKVVYIIIYKQIPFGLKIESEELADVLHFLLKQKS